MGRIMNKWFGVLLVLGLSVASATMAAGSAFSNNIESVDYATLSGGRVSIRVKMTSPLANPPAGFALKSQRELHWTFQTQVTQLVKITLEVGRVH